MAVVSMKSYNLVAFRILILPLLGEMAIEVGHREPLELSLTILRSFSSFV